MVDLVRSTIPIPESGLWIARASDMSQAGNRLVYLDAFSDPYYPSADFPKLVTPQWIGEPGVEAAVVLSIDDFYSWKDAGFEAYLRPIMASLQHIDGRAPISIMANWADSGSSTIAGWIQEGVSIEAHGSRLTPFLPHTGR